MMINELPQTYEGIAETFFENPDDRSQFRKVMLNNMKESTGVDPDITNETIAETLNEDRDEDLYQGIEKGLMINPSDPETRKNMLSNMEIIGKLSRVYPNTAIEELFSEDYLSRKIATDDVFLINATNTNTDYPVYITRWNLFATRLLDRLNQDDPSLWSIAKRAVTPMVLGAIENVGKKAVGKTFLAHGLTAAYDVSQLGNSIYNTQRDFNKRLRDIMDNKDLDSEQYVQEIEGLLDDVQKIPEEYRYDIYNSLWRGPDLYADSGLSFTSFGFTGIVHGMSALKANITKHLPSFSSQNVKHLVLNDELGQKIVDLATNSSNEEKAIEKVTAKITENQPKDAPESEVAVAKGIAINEDTDKNLRLNSNKDSGFFDRLVRGLSNLGEKSDQRGEIRLERPEQVVVTRVGKGVDNEPMDWEEVQDWLKKEQGRANPITPWKGGEHGLTQYFEYNPDIEPDYIAIQSASRQRWTNDINKPGVWNYTEKQGSGMNDEWFWGGGYASSFDSPYGGAAKGFYYKDFSPDAFDFRDYVQESIINNEGILKQAISKYDPNGRYYKRAFNIYDKDRTKALQKWKEDLSSAYALESWMNRQGVSKDEVDALLKIEENLFGRNHIQNTRRLVIEDTSKAAIKVASIISGNAKGNVDDIIKDAIETLKYEDKELKKEVVKFTDLYKKFVKNKKDFKQNEEELFEYYRHIVEEQNKDQFYKPSYIENPSTIGETQYSELIKLYDNILTRSLDNEGLKNLIQIVNNPEKYSPPSAYLQTLGDINPMKNPEGIFYYDNERGLIPFGELFNKANTEENYNKLLKIIKKDNDILDSIERDAGEGYLKRTKKDFGYDVRKEAYNRYIEFMKSQRDNLKEWRYHLEKHVLPYDKNKHIAEENNYNAWERNYLERKGVKRLWHNGGNTPSFNLSIQNFEDLTPVTLEETGIGTPWWTQTGYDNAHMIESAGDGVGFYGIEVHAPEGSKPIIIKGGKIVDKGDYKEYNPKK